MAKEKPEEKLEENPKQRRGIGRILWPLLLACLALILWLGYWQSDNFSNWGSQAEVEVTPVPELVTVADDASDSAASDSAASDDSATTDSDDADSDGSDSDETGDADMASADAESSDTADADASQDAVAANAVVDTDSTNADSGSADSGSADSTAATDAGADDAAADNSDASGTEVDSAADSFGIALNSRLNVADAAAESENGGLRLYATASLDSPTRELYSPGQPFVLVEPSEDFEAYPVEVGGISWVRVRDENGLLGWADLGLLVSE